MFPILNINNKLKKEEVCTDITVYYILRIHRIIQKFSIKLLNFLILNFNTLMFIIYIFELIKCQFNIYVINFKNKKYKNV